MSEQQKRQLDPQKHFDREKILLRYTVALDKGDFETIAAILQLAETDARLEQMILEINDVYAAEIEAAAHVQDAAVVRELLHTQSGRGAFGCHPSPTRGAQQTQHTNQFRASRQQPQR